MWVLSVKPFWMKGHFFFLRCFSPLNQEPAQSISVRYAQGGVESGEIFAGASNCVGGPKGKISQRTYPPGEYEPQDT